MQQHFNVVHLSTSNVINKHRLKRKREKRNGGFKKTEGQLFPCFPWRVALALSVCYVGVCICDSGFAAADCSQQPFATNSDTALLSTQERKCRPGQELWTLSLSSFPSFSFLESLRPSSSCVLSCCSYSCILSIYADLFFRFLRFGLFSVCIWWLPCFLSECMPARGS